MPVSIKHLSAIIAKSARLSPERVCLLAEWSSDKLYYKVDLEKIDEVNNKSYVRFEDNTFHWICNLDLHLQFDRDYWENEFKLQEELMLCCVCDDGKSEKPNEIVICDTCLQGYHQECHQPALLSMNLDDDEEWACDTCKHILDQQQKLPSDAEEEEMDSEPKSSAKRTPPKKTSATANGKSKQSKTGKTPSKQPQSARKKKDQKEDESLFSSPKSTKKTKPSAVAAAKQSAKKTTKLLNRVKLPKKQLKPSQSESTQEDVPQEQQNPTAPCDSSTDEEKTISEMQNGDTIEKMDPVLVETAKKVIEHKEPVVTNEFVQVLTPALDKIVDKEIAKHPTKKTSRKATKQVAIEPPPSTPA